MKLTVVLTTTFLLICSNAFMTFAWYAHLRNWNQKKWYIAAVLSWGIAFFEYLLQVPANRIGYTTLTLAQLKILQEVIALGVFCPLRSVLHAPTLQARFCLVRALPPGSRLLHVSFVKQK
jgi:uncharacterized protein (DUF486 family)